MLFVVSTIVVYPAKSHIVVVRFISIDYVFNSFFVCEQINDEYWFAVANG